MKRRDFLAAAGAAAVTGSVVPGSAATQAQVAQQARLDRIGIMGWGFDRVLKKVDDPNNPVRTLEVMDIPQMFADRYGVHKVEMQHSHFESTEPGYFNEFRARLDRAKSRLIQINVELGQLSISSPTNPARLQAIDLTKKWVDHAVWMGCPRVMINQGNLAPEVIPTAITALRTMGEYAAARGVWLCAENRGANWQALEQVVRAAGTRTTPDMGNFPDQANQHAGLRALYPMHSGEMHAKLNPERYDFLAALQLVEGLGFDGIYSIEADPPPADPYTAVQTVRDILLANIRAVEPRP